jgi:hypothetical protein
MAVTSRRYGRLSLSLWGAVVNWLADDIRVILTTAAYVPDQDTHQYRSDVTNEVVGAGYVAGGIALAGKTITYTAATNLITLDANDVQWPASTITARVGVVFDNTPVLATAKPLLAYEQSDVDLISTAGLWQIVWNASGILTESVT